MTKSSGKLVVESSSDNGMLLLTLFDETGKNLLVDGFPLLGGTGDGAPAVSGRGKRAGAEVSDSSQAP